MRFLHSYWTKPRHTDYNYSVDLWYAALSVTYIHKLGHEIVLYTDSLGELIFGLLPYDNIYNVFDNLHEKINPHIWSASKFKAIEMEPLGSIHIDYDFILKDDDIIKFDWYHDMLCQHMILNNPDYEFVSRYIRKACPDLQLPEGMHHNFTEHILHLGIWAIYNQELKDKIIDAYTLLSEDLTSQFPEYLWDANSVFIPNLTLEEKLVGELSKPYKIACMIDIWDPAEKTVLYKHNDICEHFAGKDKKYKVDDIKKELKEQDEDLYNKILAYTSK